LGVPQAAFKLLMGAQAPDQGQWIGICKKCCETDSIAATRLGG